MTRISINSLIDKLIIVNVDSESTKEQITKKVTESLLSALKTIESTNQSNMELSNRAQSEANDHRHRNLAP